ncbi:MAG: response regulator [Desulfobacterales bacterium]|nr:response regulator [Desulfobacterales bacterium]
MRPVILCIDDEESVIITIKKQLKFHLKDEYTIEVAESGEEALELLKELYDKSIDVPLVICDQIMPGLKGDEVLEKVHILLPNTLTILLTGQASVDDLGKAVNKANLYRYMSKPWEEIDLSLTVKEAIKSYYQEKNLKKKHHELENLNEELKRKVETFYKFVPVQFLEILNREKNFEQIELGLYAECHLTVLFADIRSFTNLSENLKPHEVFRFLNAYLAQMGPLIRKHSGFIDKYIGDSIMGLFENPDSAMASGIDMINHLTEYNEGRKRAGYEPIRIGIGINTGDVTLGTIGESHRFETTVIGDVVNVASRIESLNKRYDTCFLISEATYESLKTKEKYHIRFIDRLKVKGKLFLISVYEVFDGDPPKVREGKQATLKMFKNAMRLYQQKAFRQAKVQFEACFNLNPGDSVAQVYIERCRHHLFTSEQWFESE